MMWLALILLIAIALLVVVTLMSKKTARLDHNFFDQKWSDIQTAYQKSEDLWPQVIIDADKLVDEALKQSRYSGKNMGERLVSANRVFRDPDAVWKAHKLRNKLVHEHSVKLQKKYVSFALRGFRKALKDLGAL